MPARESDRIGSGSGQRAETKRELRGCGHRSASHADSISRTSARSINAGCGLADAVCSLDNAALFDWRKHLQQHRCCDRAHGPCADPGRDIALEAMRHVLSMTLRRCRLALAPVRIGPARCHGFRCRLPWTEPYDTMNARRFLVDARGRATRCVPTGCPLRAVYQQVNGGEGGIRTHGTLAGTPHFECGTFDHSATSPQVIQGAANSPSDRSKRGL